MSMATAKQNNTHVGFNEQIKTSFRIKSWWIFSWHEKIKSESIGKDLVIYTAGEKYDNIYVDNKKLS